MHSLDARGPRQKVGAIGIVLQLCAWRDPVHADLVKDGPPQGRAG